MREIIFRGKKIDTGQWVYGDLTKENTSNRYMVANNEVKKETIGQYIGLTDCNGKKVFEGDRVICSKGCPHTVLFVEAYGGLLGGMPAFYLSDLHTGYSWTGEEKIIGTVYDPSNRLG